MENYSAYVVTTPEEFLQFTRGWNGPIALDVETAKDVHLLGVAVSDGRTSLYIPITEYDGEFVTTVSADLKNVLQQWLRDQVLIGHNFTYDKRFVDSYFRLDSKWTFDTRIGWHLASAPSGPRPYGLKDAMQEVLGWDKTNEEELKREVEAKGGKLKTGDHYLASRDTLARYACLDVVATFRVYAKLNPWFIDNEYHWMMELMMNYNQLLERNTQEGVFVDVPGLQRAHQRLLTQKEAAKKRMFKLLGDEIGGLEEDWKDRRKALYKREYNRVFFQNHPEKWERFNLNSDVHKRELFFDKLGLPVLDRTASGLPSTGADSIKQGVSGVSPRIQQAMESYLKYEKANTISTNFSAPYLDSIRESRLHPGFNICGTVSYRLSGFKPYFLNAPFDERLVLKNLRVEREYCGLHADLSAIEPTITAHYSEDPSLLKVFRDGLGDIYLDLAVELFPNDIELHKGYDPYVPITKAVKEQFAYQRKVAKVIQLAVQYTGTEYTVSKNLTKDGFSTTVEQAKRYVRAYWKKFDKVRQMNAKLFEINRKEGHLRNVIGRIIQVPDPGYKDLPNRFIQSSAHDCLVLWVSRIYDLCKQRSVGIKPILLDCHDSTSNQVPVEQVLELEDIYKQALQHVNDVLNLSVTIKAETKRFSTLAGLKGEE